MRAQNPINAEFASMQLYEKVAVRRCAPEDHFLHLCHICIVRNQTLLATILSLQTPFECHSDLLSLLHVGWLLRGGEALMACCGVCGH